MRTAYSVLLVSTLAFTVCFTVWTMFGVIGIPIRRQLGLNNTQFGLLIGSADGWCLPSCYWRVLFQSSW